MDTIPKSPKSVSTLSSTAPAITRRTALKSLTAAAAAAALLSKGVLRADEGNPLGSPLLPEWREPGRPVTAVVLGAGNRGNVYAAYSQKFPKELKIVGVAEPLPFRKERFGNLYQIPEEYRWETWEHALERPKFADAVIITTPDHLHYGPAMKALELGYDMILEKVIAQTWKECNDILELARARERIVAVCHVLRYTPYFRQLKHVIDSGRIGDVVSVDHLEPVGHIHMSHSFVRGPWRNAGESNPMILSKSCHDTDILRWLIGKSCRRISSFGKLSHFRPEMAPEGSAKRCTEGCAIEGDCPFSALKIYLQRKVYLGHLHLPDHEDATILKALKEGPFGRCVYHCDNDVVDHQVTNMEFGEGVTASFSMEALTSYHGRRTRVMGTLGDAVGDENELRVCDFRTREKAVWNAEKHGRITSGHGGGDHGLVRDFVQAVSRKDPGLLSSTLQASMESHLMGFMAEESRKQGGVIKEVRIT
ncbi:MAG: Gfo/Idh/MocA family protein [Planctomycetota bacterium]|jgi:predicted dehydrogenase